MKPTPDWFIGQLQALGVANAVRFIVAYSGGTDSSVLLHLAARSPIRSRLSAVHVDHGLSPRAADWAQHCQEVCRTLGVPITVLRAEVGSGPSLEAAAREARYGVLEPLIDAETCLLTAHHQDDQAETVLLNLMRASGPLGLAGIPASRAVGDGVLARPLLGMPREALVHYAKSEGLECIEDDSNADLRHDRNFLRHEVLPLLESRFENASVRLSRSAELLAEAASLLDALAAADLEACGGDPRRLGLAALRALGPDRQRNLLRYAIRRAGVLPGGRMLETVLSDLVAARDDAQPLVEWADLSIRRFQDALYLLRDEPPRPLPVAVAPGARVIELGAGLGSLCLDESDCGIDPARLRGPCEIRYRSGGETVRRNGQSRKLKKLLQEAGVVPWMRAAVPLIYAGGELVAVADLWIDDDALARPGLAVSWRNGPLLR